MSKKSQFRYTVDGIMCPHCDAINPLKAYVCLNCFQVIHSRGTRSFWQRTIQGSRIGLLLSILFCLVSTILVRRWLTRVEVHMNTIQAQNQVYHESLTEFMKAKTGSTIVKSR